MYRCTQNKENDQRRGGGKLDEVVGHSSYLNCQFQFGLEQSEPQLSKKLGIRQHCHVYF